MPCCLDSFYGVPAEAADQMLGIFAASRAGEFAAQNPTLATLLGAERAKAHRIWVLRRTQNPDVVAKRGNRAPCNTPPA
jgi:hypothetical protein